MHVKARRPKHEPVFQVLSLRLVLFLNWCCSYCCAACMVYIYGHDLLAQVAKLMATSSGCYKHMHVRSLRSAGSMQSHCRLRPYSSQLMQHTWLAHWCKPRYMNVAWLAHGTQMLEHQEHV